jgi:hypothetical protein
MAPPALVGMVSQRTETHPIPEIGGVSRPQQKLIG